MWVHLITNMSISNRYQNFFELIQLLHKYVELEKWNISSKGQSVGELAVECWLSLLMRLGEPLPIKMQATTVTSFFISDESSW